MGTCTLCQRSSSLISTTLGMCVDCIRHKPEKARPIAHRVHGRIRREWELPETAPRHTNGISCDLCVNACRIKAGGWGYCGLRQNVQGQMKGVSASRGKSTWYHDPLPTNCVGDWVCPGGTGCGYPEHAYKQGPEYGYKNLAVFPHACTFHCLYCQNWHFRYHTRDHTFQPIDNLVGAVRKNTACICYFGGDPSPQLPFLLRASRMAQENAEGRLLRLCWETNGAMSKALLKQMLVLSQESGGCIKFDLKAWDENLHLALTGVTNRQTLANFKWLAQHAMTRPVPPLVIASTLLVPGYTDAREVSSIAGFIAALDPEIPYSLLAFHPEYQMKDLPATSRQQAEECLNAARRAGLQKVKVGNLHLLW